LFICSNSHIINGYSATPKQEQVEAVTDKSQQRNHATKNTEQPVLSAAEIEQDTNSHAKSAQPTETVDKKTEQITLLNVDNQPNGIREQPTVEVQQSVLSKEENKQYTNDYKKSEETSRCKKNEVNISTNEKLEEPKQLIIPITESQELVTSHEENKQSTVAIEEQKQLLPLNEKFELESSPTTDNQPSINISKKFEQSNGAQQSIISSTNAYEKSVTSKPSASSNDTLEQLPSEESLQPIISNPEAATTPVETNEKLGQPKTEDSSQVISITEKNIRIRENNTSIPIKTNKKSSQSAESSKKTKKNTVKLLDNEISLTSKENFEQPIVKLQETNQASIPIEQTNKFIDNSTITNNKLEQSIIIESPPCGISNGKTAPTLDGNNPSNVTNKKSTASNGDVNKSTTGNKKSSSTTKKTTQIPLPNKEHQHSTTSNKHLTQSTVVVNESEQRKATPEQQMETVVTTSKGDNYSDIIKTQSLKVNNESVQAKAALEKHEHSIVSKKKVISSTVSLEKPKQTLKTEQVPFKSIAKQSEVPLEKHDQSIMVIEEPCPSAMLNGKTKKPSTKNKKPSRSNSTKETLENPPVNIENSQQPILNNEQETDEEKFEPSVPSLNITSEVQNSPTTSSIGKLLNNE
jgi:hypothetical protein